MADKLRILLADGHNVVRAGPRARIDARDDMEVVAEESHHETWKEPLRLDRGGRAPPILGPAESG